MEGVRAVQRDYEVEVSGVLRHLHGPKRLRAVVAPTCTVVDVQIVGVRQSAA